MARALLLVAAVVAFAFPARARACKSAVAQESGITAVTPLDPRLAVSEQRVSLRCRSGGRRARRLACDLVVHTRVENRSASMVHTAAVFGFAASVAGVRVHQGSLQIERAATRQEYDVLLATFGQPWVDGKIAPPWSSGVVARSVPLRVPPQGRVELVTRAVVSIRLAVYGCARRAINARHLVLSPPVRTAEFDILAGSTPTEASSDVDIELPRFWRASFGHARAKLRPSEPGLRRATYALQGGDDLRLRLRSERAIVRGGPMVAAGVDLDDAARARLRVGWEFAAPQVLIHGLAFETNLRSVTAVASTEAATASMGALPSFGLGVGVPVRVWPDPRAGIRTQLTLSWPVVSVLGTFDAYPVQDNVPGRAAFVGGVMVQFGF